MEKGTIVWVIGRLEAPAGGERLLLEGAKYYREQGYDVHIITWHFNEAALYDGSYECKNIHIIGKTDTPRNKVFKRAAERLMGVFSLIKLIRLLKPKFMIAQGDYDVALVYFASIFTSTPYAYLVFGQMYQYPKDIAKYSLMFRRHLKGIVTSYKGYSSTIPLKRPKSSLLNVITSEIICVVRYFAARKAFVRVVFSEQVKKEVKLVYGKDAIIAKGAFNSDIFSYIPNIAKAKEELGIAFDQKVVLSASTLNVKKRIDLILQSFSLIKTPNCRLIIAGKGPEEAALQSLTVKLGLESRVQFIGFIPEKDLFKVKSMCDVFISLDVADFDISPLEALALDTRMVCTSDLELDTNLKTHSGIFISASDSEVDVADSIDLALNYKKIDDRDKLKQYTWSHYFDVILTNFKR
ncbi:glycosyltransferase family 4 protein [Williamwhitmania taraxaci]|uniref:Glycosyltransferase involved in cell wall bisynthesis n=1 Tax=Williamwhitmania taraxaci TaxID=1640674 RepID=A0A1G6GM53_9BACT|nr:glycosyltransferase family 4 protein [Williamwhitmania taraxaci]SDB82923.1 Glycosyltransferase involved in cell wall bisynthesis [Williamwhitmania taraxaci]